MSAVDDDDDVMCDHCPDAGDPSDGVPCRFWLKGQPCPDPIAMHA